MGENKLLKFLEELEQGAQGLQDALLRRDTKEIWSAIDQHEASVDKLKNLYSEHPEELKGASKRNPKVENLLTRSQSVLRTNRALTQTFLSVIDQTLAHLNGSSAVSYPGYGSVSRRNTPLLVSQQG